MYLNKLASEGDIFQFKGNYQQQENKIKGR